MFYTDSAGVGKSTALKTFRRKLQEQGQRVHVIAPTGRAALDINGQTTWTYAGWRPASSQKSITELLQNAHKKQVWRRLKQTDVLVIDEISMVENNFFKRLNLPM